MEDALSLGEFGFGEPPAGIFVGGDGLSPLAEWACSLGGDSEDLTFELVHDSQFAARPKGETTGRQRILVVDDDPLARHVARAALDARVCEVTVEETAGAAFARLVDDRERFDLVYLDLNLPDGDGLAVVRALRAHGIDLPVVLLTGRDSDDDILSGYAAGADFYLVKPVTPMRLRDVTHYFRGDLPDDDRTRIEARL